MELIRDMKAYLQTLTDLQGEKTFRIYRKTSEKLEHIDVDDMASISIDGNHEDDSFVVMLESSAKILERAVAEGYEDELDILYYDIDHLLCKKDGIIRHRPSLPMGFHNTASTYELMDGEMFSWCSYRSAIVLLMLRI